jgi:hypothetical protein
MQSVIKHSGFSFCVFFILGVFLLALFSPAIRMEKSSGTKVRDMSNRQVAIAVPAKRVVIFPPVSWDYITVDEGAGHIMAIANYMRKEISQSLLGQIYPASTEMPAAFTNGMNTAIPGDPEALLLTQPDAIISWAHFADSLKSAGLPVIEVRAQGTEQGMFALYRLMASMSDRSERGENLIGRYIEKSDEIKGKDSFISLGNRSKFHLCGQSRQFLFTCPAGGRCPESSRWMSLCCNSGWRNFYTQMNCPKRYGSSLKRLIRKFTTMQSVMMTSIRPFF